MYGLDHPPPHMHVAYGEYEALVAVDTLEVIRGSLPPRAQRLVSEWARLHQAELREAWQRARRLEPPGKIAPLE